MHTITVWVFTLFLNANTQYAGSGGVAVVQIVDLADKESCLLLKRESDKQTGAASTCVPVRRIVR